MFTASGSRKTAKVVGRLANSMNFEIRVLNLEVLPDSGGHVSSQEFHPRFEIEIIAKDVAFDFPEIRESQHDRSLVRFEGFIHLGDVPFVCPDSTESRKKQLITVSKREFDDAVFSKAPEHLLG